MNRAAWQQLAEDRIAEARALLAGQFWSGAYYLAGYAIECGLKSCVLARVDSDGVIFREKKFSERCWTHDLIELVKLAALDAARDADAAVNPARFQNWSEESRYVRQGRADAEQLVNAIDDQVNGVLPWIRAHW